MKFRKCDVNDIHVGDIIKFVKKIDKKDFIIGKITHVSKTWITFINIKYSVGGCEFLKCSLGTHFNLYKKDKLI